MTHVYKIEHQSSVGYQSEEISLLALVDVTRRAAESILAIYDDTSKWNVEMKFDSTVDRGNEPLSAADIAANEIICRKLRSLYPSIPIVTEEAAESFCWKTRKDYGYLWLVDPLDGTKEFIKRNGQFTVNIGLISPDGAPVAGVVAVPTEGKVCFASRGGGAWTGTFDTAPADWQPIRVREFSEDDEGLTLMSSLSHKDEHTAAFIGTFRSPVLRNMGSSLKLLLVASGEADIYPRFAPTCEWDTAAADAILREAGGECLQVLGDPPVVTDKPLSYNKEDIRNPFFVCYGLRRRER